jgi:hypothetical protein
MDRLKARLLKGGVLEIFGVEQLIERKLRALKLKLWLSPTGSRVSETVSDAQRVVPKKPRKKAPSFASKFDPLAEVLKALDAHPQREVLVRAGRMKDQLLRSLVPLYLVQDESVEITSGVISAFWKKQGIQYAAPNAAKALREHVGYARATKSGRQITPNGVQYVESALAQLAA